MKKLLAAALAVCAITTTASAFEGKTDYYFSSGQTTEFYKRIDNGQFRLRKNTIRTQKHGKMNP
jgi:hypothetical protein